MRTRFLYTATMVLFLLNDVARAQLGVDVPLGIQEGMQLFLTLVYCFLALVLAMWLLRPYRLSVRRPRQRNRKGIIPPSPFVVIHRLPIYFFLCGRDGTTYFVNAKAERDLGLANEEWVGKKLYEQKWFEGVSEEDMKRLSEAWKTARLEESAEDVRIPARFADGRTGVVSYYFYRTESWEILVYGIRIANAHKEAEATTKTRGGQSQRG